MSDTSMYYRIGEYYPNKENPSDDIIIRALNWQGYVFKDEYIFKNHPDEVCYIPEEYDDKYTRNDFMDFCCGNEKIVEALFDYVDWQLPETLLNLWDEYGTVYYCENCDKWYYEYEKDICSKSEL